jgi:hypothetical protein
VPVDMLRPLVDAAAQRGAAVHEADQGRLEEALGAARKALEEAGERSDLIGAPRAAVPESRTE